MGSPDGASNATSPIAILSAVSKLTKYIACFMNGSAAVCSRRSWDWFQEKCTVCCLKIAAASAALHRDPQRVSDYRPFGFQISCDQEARKTSLHMLVVDAAWIAEFTARAIAANMGSSLIQRNMPQCCQHRPLAEHWAAMIASMSPSCWLEPTSRSTAFTSVCGTIFVR